MASSKSNVGLMASLRSASPGELDQFLNGSNENKTWNDDGVVLSVPIPTERNGHTESDSSSLDVEDLEDEDSVISDVTWMTFRAERMKQAIMTEYKKMKESKLKIDLEELKRRIDMAYPRQEEQRKHKSQSCRQKQKCITRTMSTPDFHHMHEQVPTSPKPKAGNMLDMLSETEEKDDEYSEMVHKRGELAVEFGLRPIHEKDRNDDQDSTSEVQDNVQMKNAEHNGGINESMAGQANKGQIDREWYLDTIIELKMQLAQKQATIDHLSQVKAENKMVCKENAELRREIAKLRGEEPSQHDRKNSVGTAATSDSTAVDSQSRGRRNPVASSMRRTLSMLDFRGSFNSSGSGIMWQ